MRQFIPQTLQTRFGGPILKGALLALFAVPALLPFLTEGLTRSFDGGLHLLRMGALDRLLRSGVVYPRWMPELLLGLGYPLFSYYAPGSYYLAEAFILLGAPPYWALVASFSLLILVAGTGMFLLARDVFGPRQWPAALASAIAYMYAPYLLTNVFIRGALAEAAAQALLPWILWTARSLCRTGRPGRYYLPLALCLAALAVTHNISLLFVPPFLLGWIILHWWLDGRRVAVLGWATAALLTAAAASAFFWLPLIVERTFLTGTPYEIARTVWLPTSAWTWSNFLDADFHYTLTFARPIRLGLVQATLALLGFLLARRRDAEWLFLAAVALFSGLAISSWALPVWLHSDILAVAQFTWRLLSILSVPLALFAGGILLCIPAGLPYVLTVTAVYSTLVFAHAPHLAWMDVFAPETADVSARVFAQTEYEKGILGGGEGNSSIQEFRPRWADRTLALDPMTSNPEPPLSIDLTAADDYGLAARVSVPLTTTLRFSAFYFPGLQVLLDGIPQSVFPSTNLGLLTLSVPPGLHDLRVTWAGTPLQQVSALLSLTACIAAALIGWRQRTHGSAVAAAVVAGFIVIGLSSSQSTQAISVPQSPIELPGTRLLGYRIKEPISDALTIIPYWYVSQTPPDLIFEWQLIDASGATVTSNIARPYYNTYPSTNWPPGTVIDDAQHLNLPAGLPAGDYTLWLATASSSEPISGEHALVGAVRLDNPVPDLEENLTKAEVRFGDAILLDGSDILAPESARSPLTRIPLVAPGDHLRIRLHWRADGLVERNDHAFIHLVDFQGRPLAQEDQLPGPLFQPPMLWDAYSRHGDIYLLRVPHEASSGLYWPSVGVYDFTSKDRLPIYAAGSLEAVHDFRLPPVKVYAPEHVTPSHPLDVRVGEFAALTGFDLAPAEATLRPGEFVTITLHFAGKSSTNLDLVRFIQMYEPSVGVVAQNDGPPQDGANPTWAWLPGETIHDKVGLTLAADTPSGTYVLYAGMYDPKTGARVPLFGDDGVPLADAWLPLTAVTVQEGSD